MYTRLNTQLQVDVHVEDNLEEAQQQFAWGIFHVPTNPARRHTSRTRLNHF